MKKCLSLVYLIALGLLTIQTTPAQTEPPTARIVSLNVDPGKILFLHLRPGYVSSVRVLEAVSSVVLGDPETFKAEHSEAEPQLVFFKTISSKPAQTNALITTRSGREIALSLVSQGKLDHTEPVDYVLNCERPHSFLIAPARSSFLVGEIKDIATEDPPARGTPSRSATSEQELPAAERLRNPHWQGKSLRVAVGPPIGKTHEMIVPFAVLNSSGEPMELLPPQIALASKSRDKHRKGVKAEPVAIKDYWINTRWLAAGARADGIVAFERPSFKESTERLLLSVSQASEVDHPVFVTIAFVSGGAK
jgi:hypothetical protein